MKKKFVVTTAAGLALLALLAKSLVGGFLYAPAAFFTREGWEKWRSRRRG